MFPWTGDKKNKQKKQRSGKEIVKKWGCNKDSLLSFNEDWYQNGWLHI